MPPVFHRAKKFLRRARFGLRIKQFMDLVHNIPEGEGARDM
jgi:hypothetical protein